MAPLRSTWLQVLGSVCASVAASVTSHPDHCTPQESPLGFKIAAQGTWCREYTNSGNMLLGLWVLSASQGSGFSLEVAVTAALVWRKLF